LLDDDAIPSKFNATKQYLLLALIKVGLFHSFAREVGKAGMKCLQLF
jgi:hypothetical protein